MARDQFDLSDEKFDTFAATNYGYSKANAGPLGIPTNPMATYDSLKTAWDTTWGIAKLKSTASQVDKENKNKAKADLIAFLRPFVKMYYYDNTEADDAAILAAGLKPHATTHTKHFFNTSEAPSVTVAQKTGHILEFVCKNAAGKKAKPVGAGFIRVRWSIGENPTADPSSFTNFKDFGKQPIALIFDATKAGNPIALAVCYVGKDGTEGAYSAVVNVMIP